VARAKSPTPKSIRLIRRSIRPSWIQLSASRVSTKMGLYKFVVGRTTRMHDVTIGNQMGVNTWGTFAGSDDQAVVDGDFAMREAELQNVLKTLRKAGINVVAIHQHMVGEEPRIMFLQLLGHRTGGRSRQRTSRGARRHARLAGGSARRRRLGSWVNSFPRKRLEIERSQSSA